MMKLDVARVDVYSANLQDKPGALAKKLTVLADAGANLEFLLAHRHEKRAGKSVAYIAPLKGSAQNRAAKKARFSKSDRLTVLRVEGVDKPGVGTTITKALGDAEINVREITTVTAGKKFVVHLAMNSPADATKAARILRGL